MQNSVDVYDEGDEGSHKNIHKSGDYNFKDLKNEEIDHSNIVQDHKKNLRNLIPENHIENDQNSMDENKKKNRNEILTNLFIHKEFKIGANVYANSTNTNYPNKYTV